MQSASPVRMFLRCWGARGTCPSPGVDTVRYGGNTPCLEVRTSDGHVMVLDAGTGIRALGMVLDAEAAHPSIHIFLSHRHGDHVQGLAHFAPLMRADYPVRIACGNADAAVLRAFVALLLSPPLFPFLDGVARGLCAVDWNAEDGVPVGATVAVRREAARHPGGAAIVVVRDAQGLALAYAPDNELSYASGDADVIAWRDALATRLRGVKVLVHDATYRDAELAAHVGWGHSSAEEATRFALQCGAEQLVLFHHHPERRDDEIDGMVQRCREIVVECGGELRVIAAWEGMALVV